MRPLVLMSSLADGGAERVTVSLMKALSAMGLRVELCTLTSVSDGVLAPEFRESGIRRHDLGARRLADPRALHKYRRLLGREGFDLVHAHGQDASILAALSFRRGRPLVLTRHVLEEPSGTWRERLRARLTLSAFRRADAAVAVSVSAAERLSAVAALPRTEIEVIPNGIDVESYNRADLSERRAEIRRGLGFVPEEPVVLMLAVLRAGKGHEVLFRALPALKRAVPRVRIALAGAGELLSDLRAKAEPFRDTVVFLGARRDVPELLAACDVVVLPSFSEALPTALMEAAAAGRPVVASRAGGTPEVVRDGETGLLVPVGDAAALAGALSALLGDPSKARALGDNARAVALREFAIGRQAERTIALWSRVLARSA